MVLLLGVVESIVAHHEPGFASSGPWDWHQASKRAERAARTCDVLCFGDSQLKLGVVPGVIEERTGRRAFNLALIGGQMPAATVLLRRALDAGARPSAVVLETLPPLLSAGVDRNDRQWPELLDLSECVELARTEADPSLFARLALAGALPSVRARHDVRAAIRSALEWTVRVEARRTGDAPTQLGGQPGGDAAPRLRRSPANRRLVSGELRSPLETRPDERGVSAPVFPSGRRARHRRVLAARPDRPRGAGPGRVGWSRCPVRATGSPCRSSGSRT